MEGGDVCDVTDDERLNKANDAFFLRALSPVGHPFQQPRCIGRLSEDLGYSR